MTKKRPDNHFELLANCSKKRVAYMTDMTDVCLSPLAHGVAPFLHFSSEGGHSQNTGKSCLKMSFRDIHEKWTPGTPRHVTHSTARHDMSRQARHGTTWYHTTQQCAAPCRDITRCTAPHASHTGAPYVMHIHDLKRMLPMWQDVMRGIRCVRACVHLGVPCMHLGVPCVHLGVPCVHP